MSFKRSALLCTVALLASGGTALADCRAVLSRFQPVLESGDAARIETEYRALVAEPTCPANVREQAARFGGIQVLRALEARPGNVPLATLVRTSELFGTPWPLARALGDAQFAARDYAAAAAAYDAALDDAQTVAQNQAPPQEVFTYLARRSYEARALAPGYVAARKTRSGEPSGIFQLRTRGGFSIDFLSAAPAPAGEVQPNQALSVHPGNAVSQPQQQVAAVTPAPVAQPVAPAASPRPAPAAASQAPPPAAAPVQAQTPPTPASPSQQPSTLALAPAQSPTTRPTSPAEPPAAAPVQTQPAPSSSSSFLSLGGPTSEPPAEPSSPAEQSVAAATPAPTANPAPATPTASASPAPGNPGGLSIAPPTSPPAQQAAVEPVRPPQPSAIRPGTPATDPVTAAPANPGGLSITPPRPPQAAHAVSPAQPPQAANRPPQVAAVSPLPAAPLPTIPVPVRFETASASLLADGQRAADDIFMALSSAGVRQVLIAGHTDTRGGTQYNQRLSEQRAESVRKYLQQKGFRGEIRILGYGESKPYTVSDPGAFTADQRQQLDRRVEVSVLAY